MKHLLAVASLVLLCGTARADVFEIFSVLQRDGQQKISALKVAAAQTAAATRAQINASMTLAQASMSARAVLTSTVEQVEIFRQYGPLTGQGAQVCDAVAQRDDILTIEKNAAAADLIAMERGGRLSLAPAGYEQARAQSQLDAYCSADEHNLGLCRSKFDGMNTGATNRAKLATLPQLTSKQAEAARQFVANLVPPPFPAFRKGDCPNGCLQIQALQLEANALSSVVSTSQAQTWGRKIGAKSYVPKIQ